MDALWGLANTLPGVRHGADIEDAPRDPTLLYIIDASEVTAKFLLRIDDGTSKTA